MIETHSPETEATPDADPRIQEWLELVAWPQEDYSVRETSLETETLDETSYRSKGLEGKNLDECAEMLSTLMAELEQGVAAEPDPETRREKEVLLSHLKKDGFAWELGTCLPIVLGVSKARRDGTLCVLNANAQKFLQRNLPYHRLRKVVEAVTVILGPDSPWKRLIQEFMRVILIMSPSEQKLEQDLLHKLQEFHEPQWQVSNGVRTEIHALLGSGASPIPMA